jgi:hypothetical protein
MAAVRSALASDEGEGNWTGFNGALSRRILRTDKFLGIPDTAAADVVPAVEIVSIVTESADGKK